MKIRGRSENYHFQEKGVALAGAGREIFIFKGTGKGRGCWHYLSALHEKESIKFVYKWEVHQNAPFYYGKTCLRSVSSLFFLDAVS